MKVESITVEVPLVFRGSIVQFSGQKITATNIETFLQNIKAFTFDISPYEPEFFNTIYLLTIEYNNDLFVIQKTKKLKGLQKIANSMSEILNATIVIVKATHTPDFNYNLEKVYTIDYYNKTLDEDSLKVFDD